MIELSRCNRLLDDGFSIITVGNNKVPNYAWTSSQTKQLTKKEFEKRYNYKGGYIKKDGQEMPATQNAGIVTGFADLEVMDVDLKVYSTAQEQKAFWTEYLSFLEDNILDFHDKFVIAKTKNAGFHILYKTKRVERCQDVAKLKGHKSCILETRGLKGYVFIYDNFLNNKNYSNIDYISDEDRDKLFGCSRFYNYVEPVKDIIPDKTEREYKTTNGDVTPWDDFNSRNTVLDIVSSDFDIVRNLNDKYIIKRKGAESDHSGYIYKDKDLMYLFSTGTLYQSEKQYSAYSAYVRKHFNDDFSAATKQLYADGYGSRIVPVSKTPKIEKIEYDKIDFPIDIFPEAIQQYMMSCNKTLDSNIDFMGSAMLWVLSVIIGNSIRIEVKRGWYEKANVWIAVVGKPGLGKTPSIKNIIAPLSKINSREIKKYIKDREKFDAYMKLSKKEKDMHEEVRQPVKTQFVANDITLEALVDLHQENKNAVGVFKDELSGWMKDMNKYREGSDLEFWLSTWSGESVNVNRMTRAGSFVESPHIPVLGGIQPSILNGFYTEENKDNGFIDRMLITFPDAKIDSYNDKEMPQDDIDWYEATLSKFYEKVKSHFLKFDHSGEIIPQRIRFDSEAKAEWKRIFNVITNTQNSDDENEYMKSMFPKQKSYIPRFSLLFSVFDSYAKDGSMPSKISKESVLKAEKLSQYFVSMARKIKVNSMHSHEIKKTFAKERDGTPFDKIKSLYLADNDFNRTEASEILSISRVTVHRYIKMIEDEK